MTQNIEVSEQSVTQNIEFSLTLQDTKDGDIQNKGNVFVYTKDGDIQHEDIIFVFRLYMMLLA